MTFCFRNIVIKNYNTTIFYHKTNGAILIVYCYLSSQKIHQRTPSFPNKDTYYTTKLKK